MAEALSFVNEYYLNEVDSTNLHLHRLTETHPGLENSLVYTDFQTKGSGYANNSWESEKAKNCLFSLLISNPNIEARSQFIISKVTCLAIWKTIDSLIDNKNIRIKWPNDIYIGDEKVGGILIKHDIKNMLVSKSIIGIGLNVNQETFNSSAVNPVSLRSISGKLFDRDDIMRSIISEFERMWNDFDKVSVNQQFHDLLYGINQEKYYVYKGREIKARIVGVDEFGRLVLNHSNEIIYADFKEIVFLF